MRFQPRISLFVALLGLIAIAVVTNLNVFNSSDAPEENWVVGLHNPLSETTVKALETAAEAGDPEALEKNPVLAMAWVSLLIDSTYLASSAVGEDARIIAHRIAHQLSRASLIAIPSLASQIKKHITVCIGGLENCRPAYPGAVDSARHQ